MAWATCTVAVYTIPALELPATSSKAWQRYRSNCVYNSFPEKHRFHAEGLFLLTAHTFRMLASRCSACLLFMSIIAAVAAGVADDLVASVAKGDHNAVLQQVGHGTPANDADTKGQLPLVLAGAPFKSLF